MFSATYAKPRRFLVASIVSALGLVLAGLVNGPVQASQDATISGVLTTATGSPIADGRIDLWHNSKCGISPDNSSQMRCWTQARVRATTTATSAADGSYSFNGLEDDTYYVEFRPKGYVSQFWKSGGTGGDVQAAGVQAVTIQNGQSVGAIDMALTAARHGQNYPTDPQTEVSWTVHPGSVTVYAGYEYLDVWADDLTSRAKETYFDPYDVRTIRLWKCGITYAFGIISDYNRTMSDQVRIFVPCPPAMPKSFITDWSHKRGHARVGRHVKVTHTVRSQAAKQAGAKVSYTWYICGHRHGHTRKSPKLWRSYQGCRVKAQITVKAPGYEPRVKTRSFGKVKHRRR